MNVNPSKFTQKEFATIYEKLILLWELDLSKNAHFDVRSKKYRAIKKQYAVTINCLDTEVETQDLYEQNGIQSDSNENYFSFHNQKKNLMLSLFYILRNVAAHGDVKKVKKHNRNFYVFEHEYNHKIKLFGQIKSSEFWGIHADLLALKK